MVSTCMQGCPWGWQSFSSLLCRGDIVVILGGVFEGFEGESARHELAHGRGEHVLVRWGPLERHDG